ncbi:SDR family NAD(P)-dependent oxidoreductase [Paractinoplanes maris]|uniref:SDR family NAD(P)-dependent oxidoreductase n=1 Tax=Paractinoplanes maris TaxID=1734446 RepID=UPI0020219CE0|nr:SDR family NAD(P)-dependent oxidoreductase [Actinoplanes maris]
MRGPTAVVTGAAGGLGRATARQLLDAGFDVVAVTRDADSAERTRRDLVTRSGSGLVRALPADLLVRDDIDRLSRRLEETGTRVDVLVHNAGAAFPHYAETPDGAERTHALNHLASFQLTHRLLAAGLLAPRARVIVIASDLVSRGRLDPGHPDVTGVSWRGRFSQLAVYGTAKLAGVLATAELARRLPAGMSAYSANPGVIRTGFNTKAGGLLRLVSAVSGLLAVPPEKAAATPVGLATATVPPAPNGGFFVKGAAAPRPDAVPPSIVYEETARALGLTPL